LQVPETPTGRRFSPRSKNEQAQNDGDRGSGMAETLTASNFDRRIIEGPIHSAVWRIAWPTLFTNLVAAVQGIVDQAVVGRYVGYQGNAALGVSWQVFIVLVVFVTSVSTGMGVLVTRFAGAGERRKINRVLYQAFLVASFLALAVFAPVGYFASPFLLNMVKAAPEVQVEALPYLRTLFLFSWGQLTFFVLGGALRAAGDAQTPMRLGFGLTALNLVLSVTLVRGVGFIPSFGAQGAAIGTTAAHAVVSVIGILMILRGKMVVGFDPDSGLRPNWKIITALARFGLPTGIQGIAINLGSAMMIRFVGALPSSAEAHAAYTVAYGQLFSLVNWVGLAVMAASATVAGQNLGAKKADRAARAPISASLVGLSLTVPLGCCFLLIPHRLLGIFGLEDPGVLAIGGQLLAFMSVSSVFLTVALCFTGALQGTGDTRSPLLVTLVAQLALPLGLCTVFELTTGLTSGRIWTAILIGHVSRCVFSVYLFHRGRWRRIRLEVSDNFSVHSGLKRPSFSHFSRRSAILSATSVGKDDTEGGRRLGSGAKGS
jgi:putative MATE family efflux protein